MAVKNITSTIKTEKTIMEIEMILQKFGAKAILKEFEGNRIKSVSFYIEHKGQKIPFKLPMNLEKARKVIVKAVEERKLPQKFYEEPFRTEKAEIVGWRIIKDWIHSNLSLMEVEFADPVEIFLPYAYNQVDGKTMYEIFMEKKENFIAIEDNNKEVING